MKASSSALVRVPVGRLLLLPALLLFSAVPLAAQEGALAGTVRSADEGAPLQTTRVEVFAPDGSRAAEAVAGPAGTFRVEGLPAGSYRVVFTLPGWETVEREDVRIASGEVARITATMAPRLYTLNPITVSAARQAEKLLNAPASVAVVTEEEVAAQPALTPVEHVRDLAGVDMAKTGLQQSYVVARGFNNIFSGSLLSMTDHRIARVPSLRANISHLNPTTNLDIERVELVLGPGSALYGPNAADGVMHVITKSPIDDPGTTFATGGGVRQQDAVPGFDSSTEGVFQFEGRTARRFSDTFGAKLSGQYFAGTDYRHRDPAEVAARQQADACLADFTLANPVCQTFAPSPGELPESERLQRIAARDFGLERWSLDARADWRPEDDVAAVFSAGVSRAVNSVDLTGLGAAQVNGFLSTYYQARLDADDLFAQVFLNKSDAGDTYILRTGNPIDDHSYLLVGQLQHASRLSDRQRFVYGADVLHTNPVTNGTINGRHEQDDAYLEVGAYAQSETALSDRLDLTLAARGDHHSVLDKVIFSPRAALVFRPEEGHSLRATFNRAFSTPDNNNLYLDLLAQRIPLGGGLSYGLRAQGTTGEGFTFPEDEFGRPMFTSPFFPGPNTQELYQPARTPYLWDLAVDVISARDPMTGGFLASLPPPTEEQVAVDLLVVNTGEGPSFLPYEGGFDDIAVPAIEEETTNTLELGYKGLIGEDLLISTDVYYTRKENFIGPLRVETPNTFLNGPDLEAYFQGLGVDPAQSAALAEAVSTIPLGVITPSEASGSVPSMLLTYRNFGDVDLFGADVSLRYNVTERWMLGLAGSLVSDDQFEAGDIDVALNAPKLKLRTSAGYRSGEEGFRGEASYRFVQGFPVSSGVFSGRVDDYHLVDLGLGYRVPTMQDVTLQLDIQNLFDHGHTTFAGAPLLGRFVMARLKYDL